MPFFKLGELPSAMVAPGHSTAQGQTVTGKDLEIGVYSEPKGTGAKPHRHASEQMMLVLSGRMRIRIENEVREIGPGEVALILCNQEHEQIALEDNTRFVSFKSSVGTLPAGE